jgi:hypothetical protein
LPQPPPHEGLPVDDPRAAYVREVIRRYLQTPGVAGRVRHADRFLAAALYDEGIPLYAVQYAFIVAAARRVRHNAFSTPLPPIRSLWYFREVIREMLDRPPGFREIEQMREALHRQA